MPYGSALYPGATTYPDATTYPGQGVEFQVRPELQVLVSFASYHGGDDGGSFPAWQDVTSLVRDSWRSSRGRDDELSEFSGATATVTFDNSDRFFVPGIGTGLYPDTTTYPGSSTFPGAGNCGPMNGLWMREYFNGKVRTVFQGYAESWDFTWETLAERATIHAADEFQVLARAQLPKNTPDVETYEAVVMSDQPSGYWRFDEVATTKGTAGPDLQWFGAIPTGSSETPVIGDPAVNRSTIPPTTGGYYTDVSEHSPGDANGLTSWSLELWFRINNGAPSFLDYLVYGPDMTGVPQYTLALDSSGQFQFAVHNGGGYTTLTAGLILAPSGTYSNWYHVVAVKDSGTLRLYQNAVAQSTTAYGGSVGAASAGAVWRLNGTGSNSKTINYDEAAFYPEALSATEVANHYAAAARGYPSQSTKDRVNLILQDAGSVAPRDLRTTKRTIGPVYKHGQEALSEIRNSVAGEAGDAMFFVGRPTNTTSKGGWSLVLLDADHREGPPWNAAQATFGEVASIGTVPSISDVLPYAEITRDYSSAFLYNDWTISNTTPTGGSAHVSDSTSIIRYGLRPRSLSIPILTDDMQTVALDMLAKYKDPFERITSITLTTAVAQVTDAVFDLEIGDQIRIIHSPSALDQRSWIQKIDIEAANDLKPWTIRLGVSPL